MGLWGFDKVPKSNFLLLLNVLYLAINVNPSSAGGNNFSLLLERKKPQQMELLRKVKECNNYIVDGSKGSMLPADLIQAIRMQKMQFYVVHELQGMKADATDVSMSDMVTRINENTSNKEKKPDLMKKG
jgi:hypothetical protein